MGASLAARRRPLQRGLRRTGTLRRGALECRRHVLDQRRLSEAGGKLDCIKSAGGFERLNN
eukprot:3220343-Pyramimonas_sp.AAC.1